MTGNEAAINIFFYYQLHLFCLSRTEKRKNRRDAPWKTLLQSYNPLTSFLPALSSCLCVLSYTTGSSLPKREAKEHVFFTGYASYWWFCSCSGISVISLFLPQSTIRDLQTAACFLWSRQYFIRKYDSGQQAFLASWIFRQGRLWVYKGRMPPEPSSRYIITYKDLLNKHWKILHQHNFSVLILSLYYINVLTGGNWGKVPNWHLFLLLTYRNSLSIYL